MLTPSFPGASPQQAFKSTSKFQGLGLFLDTETIPVSDAKNVD